MRYGVALTVIAWLLIAVPAAARQQAETVTVRVGQTVPLKTIFNKKQTYTFVVSGLITRTLNDGSSTIVYDPFHGMQAANCQNAGLGVYLQIKDARGDTINASDAYRPPVYTIPCRKDHRYEFTLNDAYPPAWDINGRATAYIALGEAPGWTTSGSFTLRIKSPPRRDVIVKVLAADERAASKQDPLLADARLLGAGRIRNLDGDKEVTGAFALRLLWVDRDDTELTLMPVNEEAWRFNKKKRSVFGVVSVVKSNDPSCRKGYEWLLALRQGASDQAAIQMKSKCAGLPPNLVWTQPTSTIAVTVREALVN